MNSWQPGFQKTFHFCWFEAFVTRFVHSISRVSFQNPSYFTTPEEGKNELEFENRWTDFYHQTCFMCYPRGHQFFAFTALANAVPVNKIIKFISSCFHQFTHSRVAEKLRIWGILFITWWKATALKVIGPNFLSRWRGRQLSESAAPHQVMVAPETTGTYPQILGHLNTK